jgi:hypothetical protein
MSGSEFGPARCRPGSRKRRCFARIALHSELVVGRLGPRQELLGPLSVPVLIAPEQQTGVVLLGVCEPRKSSHPSCSFAAPPRSGPPRPRSGQAASRGCRAAGL